VTAARVRLPGGVGPAERSVLALLVDLAGRRGRVTVNHAHVGAITCLPPAVVLRALDGLLTLGLLAREGQTLVLTTPAGAVRT
jgi:hypothetical protein